MNFIRNVTSKTMCFLQKCSRFKNIHGFHFFVNLKKVHKFKKCSQTFKMFMNLKNIHELKECQRIFKTFMIFKISTNFNECSCINI